MTWEQRYRLKLAIRTSLVLWAGLARVAALCIAPWVRSLDRVTGVDDVLVRHPGLAHLRDSGG